MGEDRPMRCDLCEGKVEEKLISYTLFYEGHWIIVENVPAKVCHQCGEKLFAPDIVEKMQNIVWSKQRPRKKVNTPVFSLSV